MRVAFWFVPLSVLAVVGCGNKQTAELRVWQQDPALLKKLDDEEFDFHAVEANSQVYSIKRPAGYGIRSWGDHIRGFKPFIATRIAAKQQGNFGWLGREGKPTTEFFSMVGILAAAADDPESYLRPMIDAVKPALRDWAQSPTEIGYIDNILFARITYSGNSSDGEIHGVLYAGVDENRMLQLRAQTSEPNYDPVLNLLETSLRTFVMKRQ